MPHPGALASPGAAGLDEHERVAVERVLSIVRQRTGTDFGGYRPATIGRRLTNRMISLGITGLGAYLPLLESSPAEAHLLLERLTIKVSRFYRNRRVFDLLRHVVLPQLAAARRGAPLRIWSAGCGNGEEAYTFAMLLDEAGVPGEVIATDVDRGALAAAGIGRYASAALGELPEDLRARYLRCDPAGSQEHVVIADALRARVHFLPHDLTRPAVPLAGPPFQVIACRNVLIYLQPAVQEQILRRLRASLVEGGVLVLGEAEWLPPALLPSLAVLDARARLFRAGQRREIRAGSR